MIYLLTAIGLSPGGSGTVHIYTQTIYRTTQITTEQYKWQLFGRVRAVPRLCKFYPGICLTPEEKARKTFSQGKKNLSQVKKTLSQSTVYIHKVSQEGCARIRENVPNVKVHRYNPKHLYLKLNGYGNNDQRSLKVWQLLHTYWLPNLY